MKHLLLPLLLLAVLIAPAPAHAAPGDQVLDDLVDTFAGSTSQWLGRTSALARNTAAILLALEAVIFLTFFILRAGETTNLALLEKALVLVLCQALLTYYPLWLPKILSSFERLGQEASGTFGVSPSALVDIGIGLAGSMIDDAFGPLSFTSQLIGAGYLVALAVLMVFAAYVVIAGRMVLLLIESNVLVGGTFIAAAFGVNRLTASITDAWIGQFFRLGFEVFFTYILVTPGIAFCRTFPSVLETHQDAFSLWGPFYVLAASWIFAYVVWTLPGKLATALTSNWNIGIAAAHRVR